MKQNTRRDASAKAAAARRVLQLRREVEEQVEQDDLRPATKNEMLEALGSAFRLPQGSDHAKQAPEVAQSGSDRRHRAASYNFTAEDITALREGQGLSWKQVATNLDLGRSGAARLAYERLTGKDARETIGKRKMTGMVDGATGKRRKTFQPMWNDDSDQDEIIERLHRAVIVVERSIKGTEFEEEIRVQAVQRLTWDGAAEELCVHFSDRETGGTRSVLVRKIKEVR